jgi:aspartate aminotransferase
VTTKPRGVSQRLASLEESPTLAVTALAKEMRAAGHDVIGLGAGEPDFDTPEHIKAAARQALTDGVAKYPPVPGVASLRQAIAEEVASYVGAPIDPTQVMVSVGGKHALYNLFQALLDPGDEVILPAPYWVSYPAQVQLAGGRTVVVPTDIESGFKVDPDAVRAAVTDRTQAIVLNSPSNPTGAALPFDVLEAIAAIAVEHNLWIVSDDIYREIVYPPFQWRSVATISREVRERTIVVSGVSKSYAMTGWRIGWTVGAPEIISAMSRLQSQSTSGAPAIAQHAALAAVTGPRQPVEEFAAAFRRRRDLVVGMLREGGIPVHQPEGAFYVFPSAREASAAAGGDVALAKRLIEEHGVATVPGSAFGTEGFLRLSYAEADDVLREGVNRVVAGLVAIAG